MLGTSFSIFLWVIVSSPSFAEKITFCTRHDCYTVEQAEVDKRLDWCDYKSLMMMLVVDWKQINRFQQVRWVAGGKEVVCMERIPNMFLSGQETEQQLQWLEKLRCSVQNLKVDPVLSGQKYFNDCVEKTLLLWPERL
tara:strand:- start:220 stop:633 length:414 start_codon:yes stop_codon:yes gene_type:complete